jgi:hypothetical protein
LAKRYIPPEKAFYNTNILDSEPSGCEADYFTDGQCNNINNNKECGWDGGDCPDPDNEETYGKVYIKGAIMCNFFRTL